MTLHVGTAEDVLGSMADGWQLRGLTTPGKRGLTYWLLPNDNPAVYAAKRVSIAIVTRLAADGAIYGTLDDYGEMRYRLVTAAAPGMQERLLELGA